MARRLESLQKIIFTAKRCFQTLHTGERVYFSFKREVKSLKTSNGLEPYVYIKPEDPIKYKNSEGLYPVRALFFEMPDGEIVK